jgi:glycosyltransferase involved in cell wall biosynthesis
MTITVAIATYKRPRSLVRCLASLAGQERAPDEVLVVGQGDDRATQKVCVRAAACRIFGGRLRYIHIDKPNIVAAENAAVASATAEVVAFLDDDATAAPDWLRRIESSFDDAGVGGVGGPYVEHSGGEPDLRFARYAGRFTWYGRYVSRQWCFTPAPVRADVLSGSNMAFRRELIPVLPKSLRPYWNAFEVFLCGAIRQRRFEIVFDPRIRVNHFREARRRYYSFDYRSERELRRRLFRDNAHNFIFALASHRAPLALTISLLYEFLVGDSGRPGLLRAAVLCLEGRWREGYEGLGPSLIGRCEGLVTFFRERRAVMRADRRDRLRPAGIGLNVGEGAVPGGMIRKTLS